MVEVEKAAARAAEARLFWNSHALDGYQHILLLPHANEAFHALMLASFSNFLGRVAQKNGGAPVRALVIAAQPAPQHERYEVMRVPGETIDGILALYCMYEFTDTLIVGSFTLPHGRKLQNLLETGVSTEAELATLLFEQ